MKLTQLFPVVSVVACLFGQDADAIQCQAGFHEFEDGCYWFSPDDLTVSWIEAKGYCETLDSYLAIITSAAEDDFIREKVLKQKAQGYWIGATQMKTPGTWFWVSKGRDKPVIYTNWANGEPSGKSEKCLQLYRPKHLLWNDRHCNIVSGFICEQNGVIAGYELANKTASVRFGLFPKFTIQLNIKSKKKAM